jgi:selenide,water dikinase
VRLGANIGEAQKALLTDPQTSGGLLVACAPEAVDEVLAIFRSEGFDQAAVVGEMVAGAAEVQVLA